MTNYKELVKVPEGLAVGNYGYTPNALIYAVLGLAEESYKLTREQDEAAAKIHLGNLLFYVVVAEKELNIDLMWDDLPPLNEHGFLSIGVIAGLVSLPDTSSFATTEIGQHLRRIIGAARYLCYVMAWDFDAILTANFTAAAKVDAFEEDAHREIEGV